MNIARCRRKKEITQLQENKQGNKSNIAIDKRDEVGLKFQDQRSNITLIFLNFFSFTRIGWHEAIISLGVGKVMPVKD